MQRLKKALLDRVPGLRFRSDLPVLRSCSAVPTSTKDCYQPYLSPIVLLFDLQSYDKLSRGQWKKYCEVLAQWEKIKWSCGMTDCNEYKQISSLSCHLPDNSRQFIDDGLVRSGTMAILVLFNYRKYPDKAWPFNRITWFKKSVIIGGSWGSKVCNQP